MGTTLIMVGYLPALLPVLDEVLPDDTGILIIEDPDLINRPPIQKALAASDRRKASLWPYAQSATADAWYHRNRDLEVVGVLPSVEYAVTFAARLAERFGVPGASLGAAHLLRDKSLLRAVSAAAGLRNPAFAPVETVDDVHAFAKAHPGSIVLKPTNRQASVGTRIVRDPGQIDQAWQEARSLDEAVFVAFHHLPLRMQVEEFIDGEEFSVELLQQAGQPLFANVTGKLLYPGDRPVEFGHIVPADVPSSLSETLVAATAELLSVVGFGTGVVHCEWIVRDGDPYLVECTGRLPGDGIVHLIEHAWPIDLVRRYVVAMMGGTSEPAPAHASLAAATLFPAVEPGLVTAVEGMDLAAAVPGVYVSLCSVQPGDRVNELRSSWDRVVGVATCAATAAEALAAAQTAIEKIVITTVPDSAHDPVPASVPDQAHDPVRSSVPDSAGASAASGGPGPGPGTASAGPSLA
jgi:biotin carboxylase